ncbi:DUF4232 domain-containing protein [Streptomyces sp. NPDC001380]|uniref:DUF4232 domain-containing protein n=1 Tax=Streptomyces sp. NPDC001380 TaxID=3364566 RepID=UPI0036BF5809
MGERPVRESPDGGGPRGDGPDGDGLYGDEREVRELFHRAVEGLAPTPDALRRIQHAVPRRRARRRQAWTGAAALLLLAGASVPALWTATGADGGDRVSAARRADGTGAPLPAASGSRAVDSTPRADLPLDGSSPSPGDGAGGTAGTGPAGSSAPTAGRSASGAAGGVPPGGARTGASSAAAAPACRADQLSAGASGVDPADAAGRVYGFFSVVNSSSEPCTVEGAGTVQVRSAVGTDASKITILVHTGGDPASGLPAPSAGADRLVLRPGSAYRIRFGWVPGEGNATVCSPTPTPEPSGSPGTPSATPSTPETDVSPAPAQAGAAGGPGAPGSSISLGHTPDAGGPQVGPATIEGACTGTVYHTGPLPAG